MDNAKSKLAWAKGHLQLLGSEIGQFANSNPYTLTREDDLEHGRHILRFKLLDVPLPICLIAGDAIYNMRACLDQLVWALARINRIPDRVAFPVIDGPSLTKDRLNSFNRSLRGVPAEAICEIDALQPYQRGAAFKTHPLWRLDEMCNLDKHRRIPANGSKSIVHFPKMSWQDQTSGLISIDATGEGFVVAVPIAFKDKLDFHPTMQFAVSFGGDISGISETAQGFVQIYKFVAESVLPRFERFF